MKFRVKAGEEFDLAFSTDESDKNAERRLKWAYVIGGFLLGFLLLMFMPGVIVLWHSDDPTLLVETTRSVFSRLEQVIGFLFGVT